MFRFSPVQGQSTLESNGARLALITCTARNASASFQIIDRIIAKHRRIGRAIGIDTLVPVACIVAVAATRNGGHIILTIISGVGLTDMATVH